MLKEDPRKMVMEELERKANQAWGEWQDWLGRIETRWMKNVGLKKQGSTTQY